MADLRKLARGQPCMVRIPGVCTGDTETVVLAHYRLSGLCGTGMKPPDLIGAWCCSACHDCADFRARSPAHMMRMEIRLAHAEGVLRTIARLLEMGAVK